jgi:hypothetical protein
MDREWRRKPRILVPCGWKTSTTSLQTICRVSSKEKAKVDGTRPFKIGVVVNQLSFLIVLKCIVVQRNTREVARPPYYICIATGEYREFRLEACHISLHRKILNNFEESRLLYAAMPSTVLGFFVLPRYRYCTTTLKNFQAYIEQRF